MVGVFLNVICWEVGLQFVILAFPGHTYFPFTSGLVHLPFYTICLEFVLKYIIFNCHYELHQSIVKKESKDTKIRNRYNQVPHLTKDTNGKVRHHKQEPRGQSLPIR